MKVQDLTGAMLDYWVAKAEGHSEIEIDLSGKRPHCEVVLPGEDGQEYWTGYRPSAEWERGGPIIEREAEPIDNHGAGGLWRAQGAWKCQLKADGWVCEGPTPLIAACRAYVASKFGPEVQDVPDVEG